MYLFIHVPMLWSPFSSARGGLRRRALCRLITYWPARSRILGSPLLKVKI